jgi:hypothetical protein
MLRDQRRWKDVDSRPRNKRRLASQFCTPKHFSLSTRASHRAVTCHPVNVNDESLQDFPRDSRGTRTPVLIGAAPSIPRSLQLHPAKFASDTERRSPLIRMKSSGDAVQRPSRQPIGSTRRHSRLVTREREERRRQREADVAKRPRETGCGKG